MKRAGKKHLALTRETLSTLTLRRATGQTRSGYYSEAASCGGSCPQCGTVSENPGCPGG